MRPASIAFAVLAAQALAAGCAQIPEPGVRVGSEAVERTLVCEARDIGAIQNLALLPAASTDDGGLWIGGETGCVRRVRDGSERGRTRFADRVVNPRPIDVDGDGAWETIDCGGGWSDVRLIEADGRTRWSYPSGRSAMQAADAMAAGPFGAAGDLTFLVGMNAAGGLRVLDSDGTLTGRFQASNVFSVAIADIEEDGVPEVLHSEGGASGGKIRVRDYDGCPLRLVDAGFSDFSVIRWPDIASPPRLLGIEDGNTLRIVDPCVEPAGRRLVEYELPDDGFGDAEGVLVRTGAGGLPCLAVTRTIRATWQRSALYVFDAEGRLVYHEIFPVADLGLAVEARAQGAWVVQAAEAADDLLIGAGSQVWRYTLRPQPTSPPNPQSHAQSKR